MTQIWIALFLLLFLFMVYIIITSSVFRRSKKNERMIKYIIHKLETNEVELETQYYISEFLKVEKEHKERMKKMCEIYCNDEEELK